MMKKNIYGQRRSNLALVLACEILGVGKWVGRNITC